MSLRAILWAMDDARIDDIPAGAFRVLLALADHAHDDGREARPYVGTLAERLRMSSRTVQRHLKALEVAGMIRRGDQRSVEHLDPRYRPTVWDLVMHAQPVEKVGDKPVGRGDRTVTPDAAGVTLSAVRGDSPGHSGVTPAVTHRNRPVNRPRTAPGGGRSATPNNPQHPHEGNARRALAGLAIRDVELDELVQLAYTAGDGDPWRGYLAVKAEATNLDDVRDVLRVLRHRLGVGRTA